MSYFKLSPMVFFLAAGAGLAPTASAQTCTEPAGTSFRTDTLIAPVANSGPLYESGNAGPVGMAITQDLKIFIAKMKTGVVYVYLPATRTTVKVDSIPTYFDTEDGLLGIAVDLNFASNHWLYAFYSDPCGLNCTNRAMELARFTWDSSAAPNNQLTNKKVLLRFPRAKDDTHHAAGNMSMDASGTLVIGTGDNSAPTTGNKNAGYGPIFYATASIDAQKSSSNSNDLRGKLLRIRPLPFPDSKTPTPGIDSTYAIPAGNLWEKINDPAFNPGWDSTDTLSKVRKEIFTFGHRNPFHPRVDSKSGWVFWGEVGPDAAKDSSTRGPSGHDEWNLAKGPGFYGHPYCNGYNVPYNMITSITGNNATYGGKYNCAATVNNSPNNTGIHHMPPAIPALVAYTSGNSTDDDPRFNNTYSTTSISHSSETAIGGPMYRYDTALVSANKFPPYYEGKIFFFDWARRSFRLIKINTDGTIPAGAAGVSNFAPTGFPTASYLDMQFGSDGALYALRNSDNGYGPGAGGGLYRIRYTGAIDNSCYQPFVAQGGTPVVPTGVRPSLRKAIAPVLANGMLTLPVGYKTVELYEISGRKVWSYSRASALQVESVKLPGNLAKGVWQAKLKP